MRRSIEYWYEVSTVDWLCTCPVLSTPPCALSVSNSSKGMCEKRTSRRTPSLMPCCAVLCCAVCLFLIRISTNKKEWVFGRGLAFHQPSSSWTLHIGWNADCENIALLFHPKSPSSFNHAHPIFSRTALASLVGMPLTPNART